MNENENQRGPGFDRRTVIKAAAWSAPVIAVAVATPLAAASETTPDPQPQPAPGGGLSSWQGGTSVQTWTASQPNRVQVNTGQTLGFNAFDGATGDQEPAGKFTSGTVTVTVAWGAGNGVTNPGSYRVQEQNLHGWTRVGSLPVEGTSGSVTYTYSGVLNGAGNLVQLPVIWLLPAAGGGLVDTYVNTTLSSDFLSEKTSGSKVP